MKRNSNTLSSLLTNWETAERALETSANSAGSAMAEHEKYLDSINGRIGQLSSSWQKLSSDVLNSELVKGSISFLTSLIDKLNELNEVTGGMSSFVIDTSVGLGGLFAIIQVISNALNKLAGDVTIKGPIGNLLVKAFPELATKAKATGAAIEGVADSTVKAKVATEAASNVVKGATGALVAEGTAAKTAATATMSFGTALAAVVGIAALVGVGLFAVKKIIDSWKEANPNTEALMKRAEDSKAKLSEIESELRDINQRIDEINGKDSLTLTDQEELRQLRAMNDELEREARLVEDRIKRENEAAEKSLVKDIRAQEYESFARNLRNKSEIDFEQNVDLEQERSTPVDLTKPSLANFETLINRLEELKKDRRNSIFNADSEEAKKLDEEIDETLVKIDKMQTALSETVGQLGGYTDEGKPYKNWWDKLLIRLSMVQGLEDHTTAARSVFAQDTYKALRQELDKLEKKGELTAEKLRRIFVSENTDGALHKLLAELLEIAHVSFDPTEKGLQDLIDVLYGVDEAADEAGNALDSLSTLDKEFMEGFDKLREGANALKAAEADLAKGGLSESTLKSMLAWKNELNTIITLYRLGLVTAQDVFNKMKNLYETDKKNFYNENTTKIMFTEEFFNKVIKGNAEMINLLGNAYTQDYENWKKLEQDKAELDSLLVKKIGKNWSELFSTYAAALSMLSVIEMGKGNATTELAQKRGAELTAKMKGITVEQEMLNNSAAQEMAMASRFAEASKNLDALSKKLQLSSVDLGDISLDDGKSSGGKTGSQGSNDDPYKDALEKRRKKLKHELEMEEIAYEQYYDELGGILTAYRKDEEKYQEEIWSLEEETFAGRIEILEDYINDHNKLAEKYSNVGNIEQELSVYETTLSKINAAIEKALKDGYQENGEFVQKLRELYKDTANQISDTMMSAYDDFISYMDDFNLWGRYGSDFFGKAGYEDRIALADSIVAEMRANSKAWFDADAEARKKLQQRQDELKDQLATLGVNAVKGENGGWYIDSAKGLTLYDNYRDYVNKDQSIDYTKGDVLRAQIAEAKKLFDKGIYNYKEYTDKLRELQKGLYDYYTEGIETIIDLTMEMIEQEVDDQVDALDEQIDKLNEIVDIRKKIIQQVNDEISHEEEIEDKVREISKLREKLEKIRLDDSREAAAKRAQLEEELQTKNRELARSQREYSVNQVTEAFDEQAEAFEKEKNEEQKQLEKSIDSWVKKFDLATNMINNDFAGTYEKLQNYLDKHRTSIDGKNSLLTAYEAVNEAIKRIGGSINGLDIEKLYNAAGSLANAAAPGSMVQNSDGSWSFQSAASTQVGEIVQRMYGRSQQWYADVNNRDRLVAGNLTDSQTLGKILGSDLVSKNGTYYVGNQPLYEWAVDQGYLKSSGNNESLTKTIIQRMYDRTKAWASASKNERGDLVKGNESDAKTLQGLIKGAKIENPWGTWLINGENLYDWAEKKGWLKKYHSGGIAGDHASLTDKEILAKLEKGEMILDEKKKSNLAALLTKPSDAIMSILHRLTGKPTNVAAAGNTFAPNIEVNINHNGEFSDSDARRYGNTIADTALDKLRETLVMRGI